MKKMTDQDREKLMVVLMDLVGEMGIDNDLDWDQISTDSYEIMRSIIEGTINQYDDWLTMDSGDRELIMLTVIAKLHIENFLLHLHKLAGSSLSSNLWKDDHA